MKYSMKGLFVILAIVFSLVAVQGVWAEEITIVVSDWTTESCYIVYGSDGEEIYGVNVEKLNNRKSLTIEDGTEMIVDYITIGSDDNYFACKITVDGKEYDLKHEACTVPE